MKALVLAGGSATRLRPLSHSTPKQLIPIANTPVLEYVVSDICSLGVVDVGVIVGNGGEEIKAVLGDGRRFGANITYLPQEAPLGLAHCVILAREFLGEDDFVVYLGDNMLPDGTVEIFREFSAARPAAHVAVRKVADPRSFGIAELDEDGAVIRLVEKPENPRSDLALIGVYFFTAAIHEAVASIAPSGRGELEITDAIQWLLDQGHGVKASEYSGYWNDTGRVADVLACNRHMLNGLRTSIEGEVDGSSTLTGPVVVEPGARVTGSNIEGPSIVGAGSRISESTVGPYTSIGAGCRIERAGVADSIVMEDSELVGVSDLRDSVIGRLATVADGGGANRLVVGDHSLVEVKP